MRGHARKDPGIPVKNGETTVKQGVQQGAVVADALTFGSFRLDPEAPALTQAGTPVALSDLDLRLLVALVVARGAPVERTALELAVWQGDHVGEDALKQRIKLLRQALKDAGLEGDAIVAVRGRGYRFGLPLEVAAEGRGRRIKRARMFGLYALGAFAVWVTVVGLYENAYTAYRLRNTQVQIEPVQLVADNQAAVGQAFDTAVMQAMVDRSGLAIHVGPGDAAYNVHIGLEPVGDGYRGTVTVIRRKDGTVEGLHAFKLKGHAPELLAAAAADIADAVATVIRGFPKPE